MSLKLVTVQVSTGNGEFHPFASVELATGEDETKTGAGCGKTAFEAILNAVRKTLGIRVEFRMTWAITNGEALVEVVFDDKRFAGLGNHADVNIAFAEALTKALNEAIETALKLKRQRRHAGNLKRKIVRLPHDSRQDHWTAEVTHLTTVVIPRTMALAETLCLL